MIEAEKRLLFFLSLRWYPPQAVEMRCDIAADIITRASKDAA
jgi:hypothetical protein